MKRLSVNIGHITNSSSVVYSFPREVLEDEAVKAILTAYEVPADSIGDNMWYRSECNSFVSTVEGWHEIDEDFRSIEYTSPQYGQPGDVLIIYGDEYMEVKPWLQILLKYLIAACDNKGLSYSDFDYN